MSNRPAFEIEKLEGKYPRTTLKPKEGGGFEEVHTEADAGWMIYLASGQSFVIRTEAEMIKQGFLEAPDLVDMTTGDIVLKQQSLKALTAQKGNRTKRSLKKAVEKPMEATV